ncbi:MAG: CRISPR system precrRNA processing endoribonuclease RAMP protein Cas6 [Magnetococcus sp. WYHC-3]
MNPILSAFPAGRYRLECRVEAAIHLPDYAGSVLRGLFGAALRRVSCLTAAPECDGCGVLAGCPYGQLFCPPPPLPGHEVQDFSAIPNPYIIEPPPWGRREIPEGEALVFHMVVVGRALGQLPVLVLSWQRALAQRVGRQGRARLERVVWESPAAGDQVIFHSQQGLLAAHQARLSPASGVVPPQVTLALDTPLRIQRQGKPQGPGRLTPRDFLLTLARRVSLLAEFHAGETPGLDFAALTRQAEALRHHGRLRWRDWTRWSGRQEQSMTLGGVVGRWTLEGDLQPFWPLLHLGQWLHVGKNATFGLGRYRLASQEGDEPREGTA